MFYVSSNLYTIGPEDGEDGRIVITVIAGVDKQVPFAILEEGKYPQWKVLLNGGWDFVTGLVPLDGVVFESFHDAVVALETAYESEWDVS